MIADDKIAGTGFLLGCLFGTIFMFCVDVETVSTSYRGVESQMMTVLDLYLIPIVRAGYPWVKGINNALDNGFYWIHVMTRNIAVAIFECLESIARFFCT